MADHAGNEDLDPACSCAVMANLLHTEHDAQKTAVAWQKNHLLTAGWPITVPSVGADASIKELGASEMGPEREHLKGHKTQILGKQSMHAHAWNGLQQDCHCKPGTVLRV